ncbi:MAG: AAA family ATPase [Bacilli bacterium]|nr:AAA family ATPase [Bacilli bacterium]
MYLKKIRTVGFKSFADEINIDLSKGITGIVGPNGSGKSNVVDAVRWVLGEQSIKSLRGEGSMSDIIFAGTTKRKGANYASVNLIFDNEDRHLPIDYSEVSIKRILYKDGENEYFINNSKCRLKDITDLLMDSGMEKDAFNIISQGEVQEILSNKPEDRRIIFESAAGVLKYKKRKEEAIRKLERTHENLSRVNDIINELEIQVEPLKEQKETALKYLNNKKELENVEIALITHDIDTINYEYQNNKRKIEEINLEINNIATLNNTEDVTLTSKKVELNELDRNIYSIQQELIKTSSNVEKLNGEKNLILERSKNQKENGELQNKLLELQENILKCKNTIDLTNNEIELKISNLDSILENININKLNIDKLKQEKNICINNLNSKNRYETELKYKIDILEQAIESDSSLSYGVKSILNNPSLNGIHSVIGKVIEMDEIYMVAIDIALGSAKEYVITNTSEDAKEAIRYLKNNELGKATFYPIEVIKPRSIDEESKNILFNTKGFVDIASNLVKYDKKYQNIILNQLGNVIIANNIDDANIISRLINHKYKIVTLDGELVHVGGSITGGKFKNNKSNIITQKYELDNLNRKLYKTIDEIKDLEEKINELDYYFKEYEEKNYKLTLDKIEIEEIIKNKQKVLSEVIKNKDEYNNELNSFENNIDEEHKRIMDLYYLEINKKEELETKLEFLNNKKNSLSNLINEIESSIKRSTSSYNKLQNELKELEISVNKADVKLDSLLDTLTSEYSMTFEKAKEKYRLEINENEARLRVNSLKTSIKNLGVVNVGAIEEFDRINERFEFLQNQKHDLYSAENTLLEIIDEMDSVMKDKFVETFEQIKIEFENVFQKLFGGGTAELHLTEPSNILETGIDIVACPPGKKLSHISLLSGGEKTLTAISLLFAILKVKTVPFSILDEVEAALDEANVELFGEYVETLKDKTQFIIITHKKKTMEYVDYLYGITMQESGISKLVSVKLEDIKEIN